MPHPAFLMHETKVVYALSHFAFDPCALSAKARAHGWAFAITQATLAGAAVSLPSAGALVSLPSAGAGAAQVHAHVYTHIHAYIFTNVRTYFRFHMYTPVSTNMYTHVHTLVYTHVHSWSWLVTTLEDLENVALVRRSAESSLLWRAHIYTYSTTHVHTHGHAHGHAESMQK